MVFSFIKLPGVICEICTIKRREGGNVTEQLFEALKRITLLTAPSVFGYIFIESLSEGNEEVHKSGTGHYQKVFFFKILCVQLEIAIALKFFQTRKSVVSQGWLSNG